jgi:8-oxo-dGTP pyrophosphatase MutT (NUDIX family)
LVRAQLSGEPRTVNAELEWLTTVHAAGPLPLTYNTNGSLARSELLNGLAAAYEAMAGQCKSRLLIGARGSQPVSDTATVAQQTAETLRVHATNRVLTSAQVPAPVEVDLRWRGCYSRIFYATTHMDLAISPNPGRLETVPEALAASQGRPYFEGILPLLLGQQVELDQESGRLRLHLAISELPYSQLRHRNVDWDRTTVPILTQTHAISIALLPVTQDAKVLFAGRASGAGSYPGMIGPYVTGNAELRQRHGLRADRDDHGLPDLLKAICREAREEVGLDIKPHDVRILGLTQTWSPEDTGIWALLTTVALDLTAAEVAERARYGDHVEGTWEVGNIMYALSPWASDDDAAALLRWSIENDRVVPQAVASLHALLVKAGVTLPSDLTSGNAPSLPFEHLIESLPLRQPFR